MVNSEKCKLAYNIYSSSVSKINKEAWGKPPYSFQPFANAIGNYLFKSDF
jgi:hypothetical protein